MLLISTDFEVAVMDMLSDSYHVCYTESSDTEDQDGIESAYSGHAQSILSSLDESIQKIDDFLAFQRRFVLGDVVCSIADPSKQLGRVVDVDMIVDLETSFGELIEGVNSRKLVKLRSFSSGDYVIHGFWLGRVSRVFDCVTVLLNNGSKCEVMVGDSADIVPISPSLFDDGSHPLYYPGQHVSIKHHDVSETVRWLCGSLKAGRSEGTICHVEVGLVQVKWITSLLCIGCISSPPGHLQDPGMLTLLSCFSSANWQIGDCCMLPFDSHCCTTMSDKESVSPTVTPHITKLQQLGTSDQHCKEIYSIAKSRIKVDVLWQDGQVSVGLDPEALLPVINIADHEFWPGQFVREKATCEDAHVSSGWNLGVVKSVDSKEKIVRVKWITAEPKQTVHGKGDTVEIVSAYELVEHPDASYLIGDIVMLFPNCENFDGNTPDVHVNTQQIQNYRSIPAKKVLATSLPQVNDYMSHIGHVTGFKDESIEVRWASGLISKVHPYEIFGLDKLDEVVSSPVVHRVVEDVPNQMAMEFKEAWNEKEVGNDSNRVIWDASALLRPFAAFRFLTNVAERIFSISGSSSSPHCNLRYSNCLDEAAECSLSPHPSTSRQNLRVVNENIPLELNVLEINMPSLDSDELQFDGWEKVAKCGAEQIERSAYLVGFQKPELFKQFDSVNNYLDHHFANGTSMDVVASQVKRGWLKRVQKEWSILKNDLPDNIFVRVYEERIDLFRASIVGQPGTPYHHGLFFFDIHLPGNYPQEPPHVHYHSGGLRLNPNLYESGEVCLSLLNTWTGSGTEVWNSETSTILQVLLSLQALVLNDKPYFNEAGYDEQIGRAEAERNSINYNENAFLLTCKSMLNILRQPPKHFEIHVEEHFAERAHDILLTCKAYMDGAQVGSFASGNGSKDGGGNSSAGFRIMLAKIFPKLVSSFTTKGIDCSQFICQATQEPPGFSNYLDTIEKPRT